MPPAAANSALALQEEMSNCEKINGGALMVFNNCLFSVFQTHGEKLAAFLLVCFLTVKELTLAVAS